MLDRYRHAFHVKGESIRRGEELIERHGAVAIFSARFIAALRVLAGPLAGMLRMRWKRFFLFNALGAISWVAMITTLAYLLGPSIESALKHASWGITGVLATAAAILWWFHRRDKARRVIDSRRAA